MLDGDEAVLGIQAEDILRGAHPIYFAGQAYMGSWDAYLASPLVGIFGPSAWPLHVVTLAESLVLIPLIGGLATQLYGPPARLPAMLLAAFSPLYVTMGELRALGGYVETLVLGTALLLIATHLRLRWSDGRPTRRLWVLAGLLTGLGLWVDILILYYLLAAAIWLLPAIVRCVRADRRSWQGRLRGGPGTLAATVSALACGALPALFYAVQHQLGNVVIPGAAETIHGDPWRGLVVVYFIAVAVPRVASVAIPWAEGGVPVVLAGASAVVAGVVCVAAFGHTLASALSRMRTAQPGGETLPAGGPQPRPDRWALALPLLLLAVIFVVYWRSPAANQIFYITKGVVYVIGDSGGRYALPVTTALTLLLARLFTDVGQALSRRSGRIASAARLSGVHLSTTPIRGLGGTLAVVTVLVAFGVPYFGSDMIRVAQSSYAPDLTFPAQHAEMLTYLEQRHIHYVWANHWIGNVVMYLTDERVRCADYYDLEVLHGPNRFPDVMNAVAAADRPTFIVESDPARGPSAVARALDALHVSYESAHFGSLWVLTPTSRTVYPTEIVQALDMDY
jgi:hypothetical protein